MKKLWMLYWDSCMTEQDKEWRTHKACGGYQCFVIACSTMKDRSDNPSHHEWMLYHEATFSSFKTKKQNKCMIY